MSGLPGTTLTSEIPDTAALVMTAELTKPSVSFALRFATAPTPSVTARFAGQVDTTGAFPELPQGFKGEAVLLGDGAPVVKSALLMSVSTQPLFRRRAAVELVSWATGEFS